MKIVVMGAGAIGSLFGGLLALRGEDVLLVGRRSHVDAINSRGLKISGMTDAIVHVRASTHPEEGDLILFTVKSYDTEKAASSLIINDDTIVLSLQNGLGNEEKIAEVVGREHVIGGVTSYGALFLEPGHVSHTGIGETVIGELDGSITERVSRLSDLLNKAGIMTSVTDSIKRKIWEKLVVNVGINAITAITGVKNGKLLEIPQLRELMRYASLEAVEVGRKQGIDLGYDLIDRVEEVARRTAENRSSMLQDISRGKKTEIDAINGMIVRLGEEVGVDTPVNRILTLLVRGIEKSEAFRR
ncbi:MAG TPA: 2-dehydropantoate 2-reductase [Candidatus Syntrophoarchaeum butanivorans]|uniref:2-dehydropantoate 2-reductase n=1 Tax=Candidatus Syntropharchaeum butanivorans TaxID=1839936 RepID=A0A1F2P552_9EURY|nr:MAG: 2-dehydropantoate 2-reductase [Candidatus Syntrophoarchaeum butanivorans]HEC56797.1 2-dehydropantoate 2-reductase [Candidatus Syntrophoarchaeum butanivorans]